MVVFLATKKPKSESLLSSPNYQLVSFYIYHICMHFFSNLSFLKRPRWKQGRLKTFWILLNTVLLLYKYKNFCLRCICFTFQKQYSWVCTTVNLIDFTQWKLQNLTHFQIWLNHLKIWWFLFLTLIWWKSNHRIKFICEEVNKV